MLHVQLQSCQRKEILVCHRLDVIALCGCDTCRLDIWAHILRLRGEKCVAHAGQVTADSTCVYFFVGMSVSKRIDHVSDPSTNYSFITCSLFSERFWCLLLEMSC